MTKRRNLSAIRLAGAFVAAAVIVGTLPGRAVSEPSPPVSSATVHVAPARNVDHVYRIVGKVRFLFFWISADDVGGARIAWRANERDRAVSLLIGSEPSALHGR